MTFLETNFENAVFKTAVRGVARNCLEGGSTSSKMSASMVARRRGFWDAEWLKLYISNSFQ